MAVVNLTRSVFSVTDSRKRIIVFTLLTFVAMC